MADILTTRTALEGNGDYYPCLVVEWRRDENFPAWWGKTSIWLAGNAQAPGCVHTLRVGQSAPLGTITVMCDPLNAGCWASGHFDGAGITERDLQWATEWGKQAIRRRHDVCPCGAREEDPRG